LREVNENHDSLEPSENASTGETTSWSLGAVPAQEEEKDREIAQLREENRQLEEERRRLRRRLDESEQARRVLNERRKDLENLLNLDPLTGLPIRREFDRALESTLQGNAQRESHVHPVGGEVRSGSASADAEELTGNAVAVGVLRLDRAYDRIRNTRDRSKALLFKTTIRIRSVIGERLFQSDRVDEFVFLLSGVRDRVEAVEYARAIAAEVVRPHEPPADDVAFGCYIGMAVYPDDARRRTDLVSCAEIALEEAVHRDVSYVCYTHSIGVRHREDGEIERAIRDSLVDDFRHFSLVYQPFVGRDHQAHGAEALLRLHHPRLGTIAPARFIPIAEESGDIRQLGQWTVYQACRALKRWREKGARETYVSVNLSPDQFKQRDFVKRVAATLKATGVPGHALKLELTEGAVMEEPERAVRTMIQLKDLGVQLAIDDFGTGYSSLNYLRRLPIDLLKIDKSFVDQLSTSEPSREIVKAIIAMAQNLRIATLAEGVEAESQVELLFAMGCDLVQGFYYAPPVPASEVTRIFLNGSFR